MGVAFLVITLVILIRHKDIVMPMVFISAAFFALAFIAPVILKPIYIAWMKLAFILGWLNTRIILAIMFYLVFAPIGLILRLFKKDLLDKRIEKGKASYWKKKEALEFNPLQYERQF